MTCINFILSLTSFHFFILFILILSLLQTAFLWLSSIFLSVLSFLITFKGLLPSSTDSSPCFHLLLFLLLSFIQNTSLNLLPSPLTLYPSISLLFHFQSPASPPVLTYPLLFFSCRPPWSLYSLSSPFHLFQIPPFHCLPTFMLLLCSNVCVFMHVCLEPGQQTLLLATHLLSWMTALIGQVKKRRVDRDAPLSLIVSLITAEHMVAHTLKQTASPGPSATQHKHTHTHIDID